LSLVIHDNTDSLIHIEKRNYSITDTSDFQVKIDSIKNYCDVINNDLDKLITKKIEVNELSSQGGEAIVYFDNNIVVKIVIVFYGDIGSRKIAAYYRNQKVVRISDLLNKYDSNVYEGNVKIVQKELTDYFFYNSKLLMTTKKQSNYESEAINEDIELLKTMELIEKIGSTVILMDKGISHHEKKVLHF